MLLRKLEEFRQNYQNSILICSICSKLDGDRVYIPQHTRWCCTNCLRKNFIPSFRRIEKLTS
ncbi:MAG: hypothetical protein ACFFB0_21010 [Promethearchaeota archaeon]